MRYEVRMSRDYCMIVDANSAEDARDLAENTPAEEWDQASWSSIDVEPVDDGDEDDEDAESPSEDDQASGNLFEEDESCPDTA